MPVIWRNRHQGGIEALKNLDKSEYDLIITDVEMPGIDGFEFYDRVRISFPHMTEKVLFIAENLSGEAASKLGRMRKKYLLKPFKISGLINLLDKLSVKGTRPAKANAHDKRKEERYRCRILCSVFEKARMGSMEDVRARVENISSAGMRLECGRRPLEPHTLIEVAIELNKSTLTREAEVIWSNFLSRYRSVADLRFTEALPMKPLLDCGAVSFARA